MIHQLIFAHPKPGMSESDFQRYWKEVHAVQYASKIPQIKKYMIDCRIPFGPEPADPLPSYPGKTPRPHGRARRPAAGCQRPPDVGFPLGHQLGHGCRVQEHGTSSLFGLKG